jgi:tetratricopeptide (TPR) repeat protein
MNDGFPDRLTQLRGRWQSDPSSRVFLQLAEEYRHLGRLKEALEVLEAGLREHPGYLSALVAKGRCLLELGEAARSRVVLERVVQQDATQMVANKLLVRAYLETGDAERARQKLDLYTLLNDRDPEIDELDRRVAAMSRPPLASDGPRPEEPAERPRMDSSLPPEEGLHPATPPSPSRSGAPAAAADIFDLGAPPPGAAAASTPTAAGSADVFDLSLPPPAAAPSAAPAGAESEASDGGDPFPDLHAAERRIRYLRALEAEGIFALGIGSEPAVEPEPVHTAAAEPAHTAAEAAVAPEAAPEPAAEPEPILAAAPEPVLAAAPELAPASVAAPEPAREPTPALAAEPEPATTLAVAPAPAAPEPAAPAGAAEEPATGATATLGFLYLRQGHLAEAEGIFREVVRREPDNSAAGEALAGLERRGRPLDAAHLLGGFEGGAEASGAARKTYLLNRYLSRLKAGPRHVS